MNDTIQERDGHLYLVSEDSAWDRPVLIRRWYPIGRDDKRTRATSDNRNFVGKRAYACAAAPTTGWYEIETDNNTYRPVRFSLLDMGSTVPDFTDEESIPAPKCRVKTRYQCGQWEKLLASEGWVRA